MRRDKRPFWRLIKTVLSVITGRNNYLLFVFLLCSAAVSAHHVCPEGISPATNQETLVNNMAWIAENTQFDDFLDEHYVHCFFNGEVNYLSEKERERERVVLTVKHIIPNKNYEVIFPYEDQYYTDPYFYYVDLTIVGNDLDFFPIPYLSKIFTDIDIDKANRWWIRFELYTGEYGTPTDKYSYPTTLYQANKKKQLNKNLWLEFEYTKVNNDGYIDKRLGRVPGDFKLRIYRYSDKHM